MDDLAKRLPGLPSEQRDLVVQTLLEGGEAFNIFPLAPAQARVWFLEQWAPASAAYHMPGQIALSGPLRLAALRGSLRALVRRHEALRTAILVLDGQPRQLVHPDLAPDLPLLDLSALPAPARARALPALQAQVARPPFDLARGPLIRAALVRLAADDHLLLLCLHHLVADGQSLALLLRDLSAFYAASRLPDLPIQYADYVLWSRGREGAQADALAYWSAQLAGAPAQLALPADYPPSADLAGARLPIALPRPLVDALQALGRRHGSTLFMTLLAAFQALLARHTSQTDLIVGTPVADRPRAELADLIGCFINTLPLRADLSGDPPFTDLLARVRDTCRAAFAHAEAPFEQMIAALALPRDATTAPLVQALLTLHPSALDPLVAAGVTFAPQALDAGATRLDLTLELRPTPEGLAGWLEYRTARFARTTIQRLAAQWRALLASVAADPARRLSALALLSPAARQQIVVEWNQTLTEARSPKPGARSRDPGTEGLLAWVAAQAVRTPDAIAVSAAEPDAAGALHLSYAALLQRASEVTADLGARGVGRAAIIALLLDRTPALLAGLLGVLGAGAAYLPLDPRQPAARLRDLCADARALLLLSERHLADLAGQIAPAGTSLALIEQVGRGRGVAGCWPLADPDPADLAYALYTSGSTGRPKGVLISHGALANLLAALAGPLGLGAGDALLAVTPASFDIAGLELFLPLVTGGRVALARSATAEDGAALARALRAQRATAMQATPATWRMLLAAGWRAHAGQTLLCGGEALPERLAEELRRGAARLWNLYGPTETTIWSSGAPLGAGPIGLGRPLRATQLYVLDRWGQPAAIGALGEIHIGGAGVARGYLGRPDLTAAAFVPNPFASNTVETQYFASLRSPMALLPYTRLYRTGDLARWRADGTLAYLGRRDGQIKLRGYRIELGEVAAALGRHPAVGASAALLRTDPTGEPQIVAYVVPSIEDSELKIEDSKADARTSLSSELRAFLAEQLPAYMIPAAFVFLGALPQTAHGKLDRAALPDPAWQAAGAGDAPQTATERRLAELWAELLGLAAVGRGTDFFAAGGHSLRATQLLARVRAAFGVDLPLAGLFGAPTLAGLAAQIDAAQVTQASAAAPPIRPAARTGDLPLSFAQQRLWFLDQLAPESSQYIISAAIEIDGALDRGALDRALNEVVRRHTALRTTFVARDGRPVQRIAAVPNIRLALCDLSACPAARRRDAALLLMSDVSRRPFDLARGPLVRVVLVRLSADRSTLVLAMHHIVSDGWSMGIFVRELTALYAAFARGAPSPLAGPALQYADYALWQRGWLQGTALDQQLAYWKRHLDGDLTPLDLPTDQPRAARPTGSGAECELRIPPALSGRLAALARRSDSTLFMTLLAALQALLARYSGRNDVVVGVPVANRARAEVEDVIGCFVNTLALRGDLSSDPPFAALLARVRRATLDAFAHQDLPFELLVEAIQPARDLDRTPIVQVMFALHNLPPAALDAPGLRIRPLRLPRDTAMFDLSLALEETEAGITGAFEYATDRFDAATIRRMRAHFLTLLAGIADDPARRLADLPLLTPAERQQALVEWSATRDAFPTGCVHDLFAEQAARTPDAVALLDAEPAYGSGLSDEGPRKKDERSDTSGALRPTAPAHLTYGALERRANQLSRHLRALGARPDARVALSAQRSIAQFVGLLGVLKSGAAYVPIDPAAPPERTRFLLEDSQARILITPSGGVLGEGAARPQALSPTVNLTDDWPVIARQSDAPLAPAATPANLAYVIYTSGSTGAPKGVLVAHRGLHSYTLAARARYALTPRDRALQFASLSFDASAEEIYSALACGAALVLRNERMLATSELFCRACRDWALTVLNLSTAYWHTLAAGLGAGAALPGAVRLVVIGGEQALPERLERWRRAGPSAALLNNYGPTETTIGATIHSLDAGAARDTIAIGRPFPGARTYVLDRRLRPAPIGVAGELYIGGSGVARGYLGRPDLTAARFIPDPFAQKSEAEGRTTHDERRKRSFVVCPSSNGARLYKTGDLARYRGDGAIEFLGRVDRQIKLRGYRIELGEIEAALLAHPSVRAGVVALREDAPGETRLVAYVVTSDEVRVTNSSDTVKDERRRTKDERSAIGDGLPSSFVLRPPSLAGELREWLRARLPDYMIPAAFVPLDALPLTSSGKIDRRALPAPDRSGDADARFVAPRTPVEAALARMWAELFDRPQIGADDHFFALGGHSLLSTQVIARVYDAFGVDLPLRALFEDPTLAGLAARVEAALRERADQRAPLHPVGRDRPLPLSFAQQRLWLLEQWAPGSAAYHLPGALRLDGPLDRAALGRAVRALVRRHEILRTTFAERAGQLVQQIAPRGADPALPLLDLAGLGAARRDEAARALAKQAARAPFDLARGPLMRLALLACAPGSHILLLTLHHIIADGWSLERLVRELAELYAAAREDRAPSLPDLPIQYADYAVWQRAWLAGAAHERLLASWRAQLAGAPTLLDLPTDHPRPFHPALRGARVPVLLERPLVEALRELSQGAGATLFMTVLAAFQVLLARYSGQTDLLVGSPIANRTRSAVEPLIGCFVNTLALRADLAGSPPFAALLAQVRATCLDAYAHQDLPFEQLVEALQPARDPRIAPLVQVALAWQAPELPLLALGDLSLQPLDVSSGAAKFDLTLDLAETPDGVRGALEYAAELFDATTVLRMRGHLRTLLAAICAAPGTPVAALPLLGPAERAQALHEWNATPAAASPPGDLVARLLAQAARTPDAIAAVCEGHALSYAALFARAGRLAFALRARGVGPESRVALALDRSLPALVGIVGTLLVGGAYVPLDPSYPVARLRFMFEDAGATVIVTKDEGRRTKDEEFDSTLVGRSPALVREGDGRWTMDAGGDSLFVAARSSLLVMRDDGRWMVDGGIEPSFVVRRSSFVDLAPPEHPAQLAYMIYTSGSTGTPKGVMVTRGGLLTLCDGLRAVFADPAARQIGLITSLSFDISVNQIFPSLLYGRTLHMISDAVKYDRAALLAELARQRIDVLDGVPSFMQLAFGEAEALPPGLGLRWLLVGGEPLDARLAAQLAGRLGATVVNIYGLSEASDINTLAMLGASDAGPVTVGRPLARNQVYILNAHGALQPIGVAGEVCIAGASVGRGYAQRPDLTAARFVPNPFVGTEDRRLKIEDSAADDATLLSSIGARMLRTGDRGRRLADGRIVLLGRMDHQLKLRGYRIELGEIEAALAAHPSVAACAAALRPDPRGHPQLVAYVVPRIEDSRLKIEDSDSGPAAALSAIFNPLSSDLRSWLGERLPVYMLPAAFVALDALPRTPNGKLDRKALPDPGEQDAGEAYVAPRTALEALLARMWANLLGRERVGVTDNFFALGGHSLLAVQLLGQMRSSVQVDLPFRRLFESPTVADLARAVAAHEAQPGRSERIARVLERLAAMSEAETRALLARKEQEANAG